MTNVATYDWLLKRVEELEHVLSSANPQGWIAAHDTEGAAQWERQAESALASRDTEPPTGYDEKTSPNHPIPTVEGHDAEMLRMLHAMVADLCVELGDNPSDVPCDIWRLSERLKLLQSDNETLARMWDRMGRGARSGFPDEELLAADHACDRTLYPFRRALVTPEKAQEIAQQVRQDFRDAQEETRRVAAELDAWSEVEARKR